MSVAATTLPRRDVTADRRPGLGRLIAVELRKMVDTRAGFWLQLSVVGLTVAVAAITAILGDASDRALAAMLNGVVQPAAILLPVVGILLVTSEWSQRTAQITFTLVPRRGRVMAAKLGAGLVLAVVAVVLCLALSVLATAVSGSGVDGEWSLPAGLVGQHLVYMGTAMVSGVAFGALLLSSAPAIVVYFVVPLAWGAITGLVPGLEGVGRWLDTGRALAPMTKEVMSATQWAHATTALALWMVVPLVAGLVRVLRSEVK